MRFRSLENEKLTCFDENFTEDADESGPVSKSVNVPVSKSEKVGTHGLVSSASCKGSKSLIQSDEGELCSSSAAVRD